MTDSDGVSGTGYTYAGTSAGAWVARAVNELLAPHAVGAPARGIGELSDAARPGVPARRPPRRPDPRAQRARHRALGSARPDDRPAAARAARIGPQRPSRRTPAAATTGRATPLAEHPRRGRPPARARLRRLQDEGRRAAAARGRGARRRRARGARPRRAAGAGRQQRLPRRRRGDARRPTPSRRTTSGGSRSRCCPTTSTGTRSCAARGPIPIATGEIEATAWGFGAAPARRAPRTSTRPTRACCGGVSEWLKVAHAAAAFGVPVAPHWHHNLHVQLAGGGSNGLVVEHFALGGGRLQLRGAGRAGTRPPSPTASSSSTTSPASASATTRMRSLVTRSPTHEGRRQARAGPGPRRLRRAPRRRGRRRARSYRVCCAAGICGTDLHIEAGEYPCCRP